MALGYNYILNQKKEPADKVEERDRACVLISFQRSIYSFLSCMTTKKPAAPQVNRLDVIDHEGLILEDISLNQGTKNL